MIFDNFRCVIIFQSYWPYLILTAVVSLNSWYLSVIFWQTNIKRLLMVSIKNSFGHLKLSNEFFIVRIYLTFRNISWHVLTWTLSLDHLPFLTGIIIFRLLRLGSYLMRATASYSSEGLIAATKTILTLTTVYFMNK